jgi:hypothetical protein
MLAAKSSSNASQKQESCNQHLQPQKQNMKGANEDKQNNQPTIMTKREVKNTPTHTQSELLVSVKIHIHFKLVLLCT